MKGSVFMSKLRCVALTLALVLTVSGCALIEKDTQVDLATPVITIGDIVYTKAHVLNMATNMANEYYYYYGDYYGAVSVAMFVDDAVEELSHLALERHMIQKLGMDQLDEEEQAKLDERAAADRQEELDMIRMYYFTDTELEGEELDEAVLDMYAAFGYTDEAMAENSKNIYLLEKLRASVKDGVSVTEEEARANFDETVATAKTNYETNLSSYGISFNAGTQTYYAPAGYRYIKNLLIRFTAEDDAALSSLKSQISQKEALIGSLTASLSDLDAYMEEPDEDLQAQYTALQAELEAEQGLLDELNANLTEATETAYANIAPTLADIRTRLAEGESFDALMAELGRDTNNANNNTGYAFCEDFTGKDAAMVEAAMALIRPGDIAPEDIRVSNGSQIMLYAGDVPEGETDFDTVKELDAITKLTARQNEVYHEQLEAWENENPLKVDTRSLKD
jgi:hypothetical protein